MKRNGFTLLEMLVVLAVFGLLMVTVTEAMRFAGTASQMSGKATGWIGQIEPADRALRQMIEQIRPRAEDDTNPPLDGTAGSMSFRTELSDPSLALGHSQARVMLRIEAGRLIAQTQPAPNATRIGAPPPVHVTVLVDRLANVRFAYWDGAHWHDEWAQDSLPQLIRIRLRFPQDDPRHWPDIIASPLREPLP
jgi:general secretion pathway protein J